MSERVRSKARPAATGRVYREDLLIRFSHCDPAGIVFFPRYLEMFNDLVEDWCRDELGFSFSEIHAGRGWGLPTVHLSVDFLAPSRIGDTLGARLTVRAIGTSSLRLAIVLQGPDGQDRVKADMVVVLTDQSVMRGTAIPAELRARIAEFHAAG